MDDGKIVSSVNFGALRSPRCISPGCGCCLVSFRNLALFFVIISTSSENDDTSSSSELSADAGRRTCTRGDVLADGASRACRDRVLPREFERGVSSSSVI